MNTFLGLGSNIGDRLQHLDLARKLLGFRIVKASSIYESEPVDYLSQPWFLNQVIEVVTDLEPFDILLRCREVEQKLHRERKIAKGPRTIDIDILFIGDLIVASDQLIVPHPLIAARKFVLVPLQEISPNLIHPVFQKTTTQLLAECPDTSAVRRL